jgi:hypothetical protein
MGVSHKRLRFQVSLNRESPPARRSPVCSRPQLPHRLPTIDNPLLLQFQSLGQPLFGERQK